MPARLSLHHLAFPCRNLEQEISFDFGPNGEFAYLYSQCYELTTNECVPPLSLPQGWADRPGELGGSEPEQGHRGVRAAALGAVCSFEGLVCTLPTSPIL